MHEKYFPEGIALGTAFLNRQEERKQLMTRIKATQHTVLTGPRRYGKTSLVMKVAEEMKIPYCAIDLFAAYNEEYVRDQLIEKVGHLAVQLLPRLNKAKQKLLSIFYQMKPEFTLGAFGQKISLALSNKPLHDITDVLLKLDETAKYFKKRAVIFIDEFQQISQLKNYHSIEASIRHAVERSQYISYVFSGSDRQLLKQMFGDQARPLFRLCQVMHIERMEKSVYVAHLSLSAQQRWKKKLAPEIIDHILTVTELHPFYMNVLCQLLWENSKPPTLENITLTWHEYVKTQRHLISHDIVRLSINQTKMITALAKTPTHEIQAASFLSTVGLSASSAQQALTVLLERDLIYQHPDKQYHVLDPAMKYYLNVILWL